MQLLALFLRCKQIGLNRHASIHLKETANVIQGVVVGRSSSKTSVLVLIKNRSCKPLKIACTAEAHKLNAPPGDSYCITLLRRNDVLLLDVQHSTMPTNEVHALLQGQMQGCHRDNNLKCYCLKIYIYILLNINLDFIYVFEGSFPFASAFNIPLLFILINYIIRLHCFSSITI